jgi:hypothetical protein
MPARTLGAMDRIVYLLGRFRSAGFAQEFAGLSHELQGLVDLPLCMWLGWLQAAHQ